MGILSFLSRDRGGEPIQAMPLRQNFINLTLTKKVIRPRIVYCVADGDIELHFNDGDDITVSLIAGESFTIDDAKESIIVSGTFHFSGKAVENNGG